MKKYIVLGAIAFTVIITIGAAIYFNSQGEEEPSTENKTATTVTSSTTTTTTKKSDDNETEDVPSWWGQKKPAQSNSTDTATNSASSNKPKYQSFSVTGFKAVAGSTRILFFYDAANTPSVKLDTVLKAHAAELPKDIYVFKVSYTEERELAEDLSVSQAGTVLKYDAENSLSGIYIATSEPDMATFRRALTIE